MVSILHIARIRTIAAERRVAMMAEAQGFSFRLVRPRPRDGFADADTVRDRSRLENVRLVRVWREGDPHRGIYGTAGFGLGAAAPDIIQAEEEPDSLAALHVAAARRARSPRSRLVLYTWQNVNRPKGPLVEWVLRRTLSAADAVLCGSRGAASLLRQLGYSRPTAVIPALALDSSIYRRRTVPRLSDAFTIGYVGRLAPEKGIDTLIAAVAAMGPPALLVAAGTGRCRAALEQQARELGIGESVRFTGSLDADGVAGLLSAVDVLVVPSRSTPVWKEQFGRVIVEAMGCGVPVVGSDSGAIPEVVGPHGLIFPEDHVGKLVEHLRTLRASPALRESIGRQGRVWALATHESSVRAGQFLDFYRDLVRQPPGAPR
jgi:glycosyltransferase involved in cell wall biosynthesis